MSSDDHADGQIPERFLGRSDEPLRAECYFQSLAPASSYSSQERLVEQLKELVEAGTLADLEVTVWGRQVCTEGELSSLPGCSKIVERIGDFFVLAAESEIDISSFFRVKQIKSTISEEEFSCVSTPARCLALYDADSPVGVFPCRIDGVVFTPEDAVTQLATVGTQQVSL